jgi:hypothetical protein
MVFTSERVERPRRGRLRDCTARARQRSDPANADGPIPDLDRIFPCVCEECSAAACGSSPPSRKDLSGLLSQRHCRWLVFRALGHSSSIFLEPFAPPALTGFHATMAPLTPARWSHARPREGAGRAVRCRAGLSASRVWPSEHSAPKHLSVPVVALAHNPSARQASTGRPVGFRPWDLSPSRSGLRHWLVEPDAPATDWREAVRRVLESGI